MQKEVETGREESWEVDGIKQNQAKRIIQIRGTDGKCYSKGSREITLCQSQHQIKLENLGGNHGKTKSNRIEWGEGREALDSWGLWQAAQ